MTAKEFRLFYLFFVNMYGVIHSDDAYLIMKKFYPSLLKKDLYKDLNNRLYKNNRGYEIYRTDGNNKFVIARDYFEFEDFDLLFKEQGDKPFFIPETLDGIKYYTTREFWFNENDDYLESFKEFLMFRIKNRRPLEEVIKRIFWSIEILFESIERITINQFVELLEGFGFETKEENDLYTVARFFQILNNNTRMLSNRGFKPTELGHSATQNKNRMN